MYPCVSIFAPRFTGLSHRRIMVNNHLPNSLLTYPLILWHANDNCTQNSATFGNRVCQTQIPFSPYNSNGYSFHVVSRRNYTIQSGFDSKVDFSRVRYHGMQQRVGSDWVVMETR